MQLNNKLKIKSILNHIVPFQYRHSLNFRKNLSFLMESMKWNDDRMKEYQDNKLREVLLSGLLNNPYYKNLFKGLGLKKK